MPEAVEWTEPGTVGAVTEPAPARQPVGPRLVSAVTAAGSKYLRDRCPQLAAAVSYHVLFSLVPLFMFLASVFGLVLRDDDLRADLIDKLLARFPLSEDAGGSRAPLGVRRRAGSGSWVSPPCSGRRAA